MNIKQITRIQALIRGFIFRNKRLPNVMYYLQNYMISQNIILSCKNKDGRINSVLDGCNLIKNISKKFKIRIPKIRSWFDILIYDCACGWIPLNIKITSMTTSDNIGNLSICVHSYTNEILDFNKNYKNGDMSILLTNKIKDKHYNKINKKDYYFLVINKNNTKDVTINSLKGLENLTYNANNLPFQVKWHNNRKYNYKKIEEVISIFLKCLQNKKSSWKYQFIEEINNINNI